MNKFLAFALSVSSVSFDYAEGMKNQDVSSCSKTKNEAQFISAKGLAPFFEGMNSDKIDALLNSAKSEIYAISLMLSFGYGIEAMHSFIHKRGLTENGKLFWDFINENPKFMDKARNSVDFIIIIESLSKQAQIGMFAAALSLIYESARKFCDFADSGAAEAGDQILKRLSNQFDGHDGSKEGQLLFSVRQIAK